MEASLTSVVDELSRRRAEEALKGSERDLKLIIDTNPALAWAEPNDGPGATFAFAIPCAVERTV